MEDDDKTWRPAEILDRYAKGERDFRGLEIQTSNEDSVRDFCEVSLEGADFSGAFIVADFSGANLRATRFARANVKTCSFDGADLRNANFCEAAIDSATFVRADLNGTDFDGASAHGYTYAKGECPVGEQHLHGSRNDALAHRGRIHDGRVLTPHERRVLRWLLDHGDTTAPAHLAEIESLRVVARCGCGCATIDFQPAAGAPLQTLSEHMWRDDAGNAFGIAAYAIGSRLGCLEVWSLDGNAAPVSLPDPSILTSA